MKNPNLASKVKKTSSEELLATYKLLKAAQGITPADCPNVKLLALVGKELNLRCSKGNLLILERELA